MKASFVHSIQIYEKGVGCFFFAVDIALYLWSLIFPWPKMIMEVEKLLYNAGVPPKTG